MKWSALQGALAWLRRTPADRYVAAAAVLAMTVAAVSANVLVARFYHRWDLTSRGLYTLSAPTLETLHALDEPIDIVVFLSRSDSLTTSLRHVLTAYGAETTALRVRYADPDRDPAEFLALQKQYGIAAGKAEDGRVVTDAALVIARGEKHWFVTAEDLVRIDPDDGSARPQLEQALTEGVRNVLDRERPLACFTTGHQEARLEDVSPTGLAELSYRLEKNNFEVVSLDLAAQRIERRLDACRVVAIVGPEIPFAEAAAARVVRYLEGGGNVLIAANPIVDDELRPIPSGLEAVTRIGGIELGGNTVVEQDPALKLTGGVGERFFAKGEPHALTAGIVSDGEPLFRVLVTVTQSLRASDDAVPAPSAVLTSSAQSFAVADVRPFLDGAAVVPGPRDARGPFTVAMAVERPAAPGAPGKHGARLVVFGTASLAWGQSFQDPGLLGNRLLVESAFSWLTAQPALVTVPEKPGADAMMALTEESLTSISRYVIVYMPATALLLGALVLYRRRSVERRSRQRGAPEAPRPAASAGADEPPARARAAARPARKGARRRTPKSGGRS